MRLASGKIRSVSGPEDTIVKETLFEATDGEYKIDFMQFISEDDDPVTLNLWIEFEDRIMMLPKDSQLTSEIFLEIDTVYFLKQYEKIVAVASADSKINYMINGDSISNE